MGIQLPPRMVQDFANTLRTIQSRGTVHAQDMAHLLPVARLSAPHQTQIDALLPTLEFGEDTTRQAFEAMVRLWRPTYHGPGVPPANISPHVRAVTDYIDLRQAQSQFAVEEHDAETAVRSLVSNCLLQEIADMGRRRGIGLHAATRQADMAVLRDPIAFGLLVWHSAVDLDHTLQYETGWVRSHRSASLFLNTNQPVIRENFPSIRTVRLNAEHIELRLQAPFAVEDFADLIRRQGVDIDRYDVTEPAEEGDAYRVSIFGNPLIEFGHYFLRMRHDDIQDLATLTDRLDMLTRALEVIDQDNLYLNVAQTVRFDEFGPFLDALQNRTPQGPFFDLVQRALRALRHEGGPAQHPDFREPLKSRQRSRQAGEHSYVLKNELLPPRFRYFMIVKPSDSMRPLRAVAGLHLDLDLKKIAQFIETSLPESFQITADFDTRRITQVGRAMRWQKCLMIRHGETAILTLTPQTVAFNNLRGSQLHHAHQLIDQIMSRYLYTTSTIPQFHASVGLSPDELSLFGLFQSFVAAARDAIFFQLREEPLGRFSSMQGHEYAIELLDNATDEGADTVHLRLLAIIDGLLKVFEEHIDILHVAGPDTEDRVAQLQGLRALIEQMDDAQ